MSQNITKTHNSKVLLKHIFQNITWKQSGNIFSKVSIKYMFKEYHRNINFKSITEISINESLLDVMGAWDNITGIYDWNIMLKQSN